MVLVSVNWVVMMNNVIDQCIDVWFVVCVGCIMVSCFVDVIVFIGGELGDVYKIGLKKGQLKLCMLIGVCDKYMCEIVFECFVVMVMYEVGGCVMKWGEEVELFGCEQVEFVIGYIIVLGGFFMYL